MDNITTYTAINLDGTTSDWVTITHDDGSFTSMLKSYYDEQQKLPSNSSTPQT
jgi:hypothetical protein